MAGGQTKAITDWQTVPDVHTGTTATRSGKYASQGVSNPPNGGQVTDVDNPEPNDWQDVNAVPAQPRFSTELVKELPWAAKQLGIGALKEVGDNLSNAGKLVAHIPGVGGPALTQATSGLSAASVPKNEVQSIGKAGTGVGEFLVPGLGEEAATAKAGEYARLARLGYNALTSGTLNRLQGGSFGGGAAMGGGGAVMSEAAHAVAPALTEFAQGIHTPGTKTGRAILDETSGIFPGKIRRSAQGVLDTLNPEMNQVVKASPAMVPLGPVQAIANANISKAFGRNEPKMYAGAKRLARIVTSDLSGNPLPPAVPAWDALELRRGVDTALAPGSFNPTSTNAFKGYRTPLRDALNEAIGNVVPEYRPLATRISRLIPATKPAKRGFGHLWGPGAGAIFGGYYGARAGARNEGGLTGAIAGGLEGAGEGAAAGTVLPALINGSARTLYSPIARRILIPAAVGSGLQMTRKPSPQAGKD